MRGVGLVGHSHAGTEKELSLLARESIQKLHREAGVSAEPGSFAENITTEGIDLISLPTGSQLQVGEARLLIIQIGKDPSQAHTYNYQGYSLPPTEGVFCKVLKSGEVKVGDTIKLKWGIDMLIQCAKCGKKIEQQQGYEHQGKMFCEDCYMDLLSPPKACDPWAVHSAQTFLKGKDKLSTLTPLQLKIVNYIGEKGEATAEEIIKSLNLTDEELRREFAALRHMEILRGTKKGDKILYILF